MNELYAPQKENSFMRNKSIYIRKRTSRLWYNDCNFALKESRYSFNRTKKTIENLIELEELRVKFDWTTEERRWKSWVTYVSSIRNKTPTKFIGIEFVELDENKLVINDTDISLAERFKLNSSDCSYSSEFLANINNHGNQTIESMNHQEEYNIDPILNTIMTEDEFNKTLQLTKDSSPSPYHDRDSGLEVSNALYVHLRNTNLLIRSRLTDCTISCFVLGFQFDTHYVSDWL